jgi:hypothetical protein
MEMQLLRNHYDRLKIQVCLTSGKPTFFIQASISITEGVYSDGNLMMLKQGVQRFARGQSSKN